MPFVFPSSNYLSYVTEMSDFEDTEPSYSYHFKERSHDTFFFVCKLE